MGKGFAWSYSKYKNFDVCPKRHYEVDIVKSFADTSEQLAWGNTVHDAMRDSCTGKTSVLPESMHEYQPWADEMRTGQFIMDNAPAWLHHLASPDAHVIVEQKLAITKDFQPTPWFAQNAWFRGVCDAARLDPTKTVGIARDWKTGKLVHDSRQLMLMAQCLFAHIPTLRKLLTEFVWFKDDCTTREEFHRNNMMREWPPVLAHVAEMEKAAQTMNYPPKPGKLCARYCPVVSCPFYGKRHS